MKMVEETAPVATVPENSATVPVSGTPEAVKDTVITESNINEFSSSQIEEALKNLQEGKTHKEVPKEAPKETPKEVVDVPKPVSETVQKSTETETQPEPSFDEKVAKAVETKMQELAITKPVEPIKPIEKFNGFKTQEELNEAFEKDAPGTFEKVVKMKVDEAIKSMEERVNKSLEPVKADLESRTVATQHKEAISQIKEMSDPAFMKQFESAWKSNIDFLQQVVNKGGNPYLELAKIVRGENVSNYEKSAYERGVKETEARLSKASRAVVEGGGKVIVETEGIDLDKASSTEILAELKRHGKA